MNEFFFWFIDKRRCHAVQHIQHCWDVAPAKAAGEWRKSTWWGWKPTNLRRKTRLARCVSGFALDGICSNFMITPLSDSWSKCWGECMPQKSVVINIATFHAYLQFPCSAPPTISPQSIFNTFLFHVFTFLSQDYQNGVNCTSCQWMLCRLFILAASSRKNSTFCIFQTGKILYTQSILSFAFFPLFGRVIFIAVHVHFDSWIRAGPSLLLLCPSSFDIPLFSLQRIPRSCYGFQATSFFSCKNRG